MTDFADHDAYIAAAPEHLRDTLIALRDQLRRTLPDAEEIISYNMPGFGFGKSIIAGYAAFSKQCGLYVAPDAIAANADAIAAAGLKPTKTGVKFAPNKSLPNALIDKLARDSRKSLGL